MRGGPFSSYRFYHALSQSGPDTGCSPEVEEWGRCQPTISEIVLRLVLRAQEKSFHLICQRLG